MKNSILRLSAFLLLALIIHGCNELYDSSQEPMQLDQVPGLTIAIEKVLPVMDLQDRITGAFFRNPEVVGTGTGIDENGNPAIVVYTLSKVEQRSDVTIENVGRGERPTALPLSVDKVPVIAKVTGMFKAYADDPTAWFPRPVPIGVSTGHTDITAGTIGCRVSDTQGNVFALSNNHVYANSNNASIGDNVLQPGPYDGGSDPGDAIGTLYDYQPISFSEDNEMDAAIALVTTSTVGTSTPSSGYGTPSSTIKTATIGLKVKKYGRTTGYTFGEISELNVTVDVCYESRGPYNCVKLARFVNQVTITPGTFSSGGDSGSLIVTDDGKNDPVGLLFAGSSTHTIANPIGVVLSRFGVTIDNESGGVDNNPPTAGFTYTADGLTAYFTDQSSDSDGTLAAWDWSFGDGTTSTKQSPSHTYAADGDYTVSLTVTDNDGATGSTSKDVTVSENSVGDIILTATGYKVRGVRYVDLAWTGAAGTVDIYRNNVIIAKASDGSYTDNLGRVSG
ncbi:MAG: PKD domain-containing protein, partial [Bacteroidales bacterium]|nr:PKD domain-containing protein [Bacteroidales bacterium]